ncbi:AAA family ATPase [Streptomyces sp. NPDC001889]
MPGMSVVERTEQLRILEEALADERPPGRVVLVEGAAATGKTTLLDAFGARVTASGGVFLTASASRVERDLPLGAVGQLFQAPALTARRIARADRLLREGARAAGTHGGPGAEPATAHTTVTPAGTEPGAALQVPARVLGALGEILLTAAGGAPLVIGVDDIHHADASSLHLLLHLVRRPGGARVLLVLTQAVRASRPHPLVHAELLRRPGARRLRVGPLTEQGTAALLAGHFAPPAVERLAAECHTASGGNPLLAHALIEDTLGAGPAPRAVPVFGESFRQAVLTCLFHSESTALAQAMAVLGEDVSDAALGELAQYDAESVGPAREALRATGLLGPGGFRHPAVPAAVLGGMRPEARTALYVRVAQVLHGLGAPAPAVAHRLLAADRADAPWAVAALRDAARQARSGGDRQRAIPLLRLALQECADEEQRPAVLLDLTEAEWQLDPAVAARRLPELVLAVRDGALPAARAALPVSWLLWLGRVDEALGLMDRPAGRPGPPAPLWWLPFGYPGLDRAPAAPAASAPCGGSPSVPCEGAPAAPFPSAPPRSHETAALLTSFRAQARAEPPGAEPARAEPPGAEPAGPGPAPGPAADPGQDTLVRAERILRHPGRAPGSMAALAAVAALVHSDEPDRAESACERLGPAAAQGPPLGNALFLALRAAVHLRRGELESAEKATHEALTLIPSQGWGVALGFPVSVLLSALIARGRHDEAEQCLDIPVPDAMFHTPVCLPYLQARGNYYLMIDRPQAALAEFQACGELMIRWGFDTPAFVPWRSDLARAHIALGEREAAGRLVSEQLKRIRPGQFRTRGISLRVLAAACDAPARAKALGTAVRLLERAGDRLELARALADLGDVCRARGQEGPARAMEQRARQLAAECGVEPAEEARPLLLPAELPEPPERDGGEGPLAGLSVSERRVAGLAASGYTNRQIAQHLHITMSTVEQHLTRVYRKLRVHRRTDLPVHLMLPLEGHPA